MSKQGFTTPSLFDYNGVLKKEWYVGFRFTCPECSIRKPYQIRLGINNFKTVQERRADGRGIIKLLSNALDSGWNPHHECIEDYNNRQVEDPEAEAVNSDVAKMPMFKALRLGLEGKKPTLVGKSYNTFDGILKFAEAAGIKLGIARLPIHSITRKHIKSLLNQIARDRQTAYDKEGKGQQWTGNSYNKYKGILRAMFSEMFEYEAVEYNPCDKIKDKQEIKTNIHRHATEKEERAIKDHLWNYHPKFFIYLAVETLTGLRPFEIFKLKISDYDMFNQAFDTFTKTKEARKVPIPNVLMKYIEMLDLHKHPSDHYIFGHDFEPNKYKKKRDYGTKSWREWIKEDLGLNVSLYSFKGLGGERKRQAGISLETVSKISFGHASVGMSKVYLHGEQSRAAQDIIENTPDFAPGS